MKHTAATLFQEGFVQLLRHTVDNSYLQPGAILGGPATSPQSKTEFPGTARVATLGPGGTCSFEVAYAYLDSMGKSAAPISCTCFEQAANMVAMGQADFAIVPAAYREFNAIIFNFAHALSICDLLFSTTPEFVLAGREDEAIPGKGSEPCILASHPSPATLSRALDFPFRLVDAPSNVAAAAAVRDGLADVCITQTAALASINDSINDEAPILREMVRFGSVGMLWAVLQRRTDDSQPAFRRFQL